MLSYLEGQLILCHIGLIDLLLIVSLGCVFSGDTSSGCASLSGKVVSLKGRNADPGSS